MITQKIKKIVAKLVLFSLLFSNFSQILLEVPDASAENFYQERSLSSSGGYFTGSSFLNSYTGNFINTGSLDFNFSFNSESFFGANYNIDYIDNNNYYSGSDSVFLPYDNNTNMYFSGSITNYFSGYIKNESSPGNYLANSKLYISNMSDGSYKININATGSVGDNMTYDFIIDTKLPIIQSSGSIVDISSYSATLTGVQIEDINFSGAIIKYGIGENLYNEILINGEFNSGSSIFIGSSTFLYDLSPNINYNYIIETIDRAGNISISSTGNFTTDPYQPNNGEGNNSINLTYSNSGQIGASGSIDFLLTNNRANSINGVLGFGIAFDERFVFNSGSVSIFNQTGALYQSGVINCSGALKTFYDYRKKIIMCELEKSFNFEIGKKLGFTLSGITNPSIIARYPVELVLKTTSNDEFFGGDTIIKDATDFSSASILGIYIQNSSKVIAEFNKPINIMQDPGFTLNINGLQTNGSYTTDDTNTKLFINTSEQVSGTNYTLTLSGVKTFNNIYTTGALIQNFIGFDPSVKRLDYVSPYNISRGTYNNLVYIYGSNNIFDGSVTNVNLGAGIFLSGSVMKDPNDLNQIKFYVNIASGTFLGNRDVTVNMNSGTIYKLFNGISINKNWGNFVKQNGIFPNFNNKTVKINFDTNILSVGSLLVEKIYGTSSLIPQITNTSFSGNTLILTLTGVELNNQYQIRNFNGFTFYEDKMIDEYLNIGFDFCDGTNCYNNRINYPIVTQSIPSNRSNDISIKDASNTGLTIEAYFDQALQSSTVNSDNVKLKDEQGNSIPGSITYSGSEGQYFKLTFITDNALNYGKNYYLELSNNIKSEKGLGLIGNIDPIEGNGHKINFTTKPDYDTLGVIGSTLFQIEKTEPFNGAYDVPYDAKFRVIFNDVIDTNTVTLSNIVLNKINNSGSIIDTLNWSGSYDNNLSPKTLYVKPSSNLYPEYKYRLTVKNTVKSIRGQNLNNDFILEFKAGNKSVSSVPLNIMGDYNDIDLSRIEIGFSSPIDSSTINNNNISLFATGGLKQNIDLRYNYLDNLLVIIPINQLISNSDYTLILKPGIKDIGGNSINTGSLINNFTYNYGNIQKIYSIGDIEVGGNLFVKSLFAKSNFLEINFSSELKDPTLKSNYYISYCTNFDPTDGDLSNCTYTGVSLLNSYIKEDPVNHKVIIEGINIPESNSPLQTIVKFDLSNIQDLYNNNLPENIFYIPVFSEDIGSTVKGDGQAIAMNTNINPQNNIAGEQTLYFIDFPISKKLNQNDIVEILFPLQFNLSNAKFDSGNSVNYVNGDINGTPKFTINSDNTKKILTYTINSGYTLNNNDYIISSIKDIINPTQAKDYSTDGYVVEITTKNMSGVILDRFKSNPIYIKQAPSGENAKTITVQLKTESGSNLNLSGAVVNLHSPFGYNELITNSSGSLVFTGILNEKYGLVIDPFVRIKNGNFYSDSNYISNGKFYDIFLDNNKSVDFILKNKNTSENLVTISGAINGLDGKEVTLWAASSIGYFEKDLGKLMGNDVVYEIRLPKNAGYTSIGIFPTIPKDYQNKAGSYQTPDWQASKPQNINIEESNISGINFSAVIPNINFTVNVQDNLSKAIPKAHIYVYSPGGDMVGLFGDSDINGQKTFKVNTGTYIYGAYIEGLPNPVEQTITITGTSTGTLVVMLPNRTVEGKVLNGSTPLSNVSIYGFNQNKGSFVNTMTDINGSYKLYVEDGIWKIGGWINSIGPLDEQIFTVSGSNLINKNFVINTFNLFTITGSVTMSGAGVDGVNIFAEPTDNDYSKGGFTFTDLNGNYVLNLKSGTYNINAFHPQYGEIGKINNIVVNTNTGNLNFSIATPKSLTISFTGSGVPSNQSDISKFEWIMDIFNKNENKGFTQKILGQTQYKFNNVPSGIYKVKINVKGIGEVYNSGSFSVSDDNIQNINISSNNKLVTISGSVVSSGSLLPIEGVYVEIKNLNSNQMIGEKTNALGLFNINIGSGTYFQLIAKKPGYEQSMVYTGITTSSGYIFNDNIKLTQISETITVNGSVSGSGNLENIKAFINIQGIGLNSSGSEIDIPKGFGKELSLSTTGSFSVTDVPKNFGSGKIIIAIEGYQKYKDITRMYGSSNINLSSFNLVGTNITKPLSTPIIPSQGGLINDLTSQVKVILPSSALGNGSQPGSVITKETGAIPNIPGQEAIGGKAKEIRATDSNGNSITDLTTDATIEITYSGSELYSTYSGITLDDIKHLQISYYDDTSVSWKSLPTTVESSSGLLFENYSGSLSTLLKDIPGYSDLIFTLKAQVNHFTLFTSLISTAVSNSSSSSQGGGGGGGGGSGGGGGGGGGGGSSIVSGIAVTVNNISKYLGNVKQAIVLKSGTKIDQVLTINREGKVVALKDILSQSTNTISNIGENLVNFAVGDIISTQGGSVEIALNGYTKMNLSPGASIKIAAAGSEYITYENINGKTQYEFTSQNGGKFQYQVKGKTGYATIRGTTLEVSTSSIGETYKLISGKIDIYNSVLKKSVSLVVGDTYIAYVSGEESIIKASTLNSTGSINVSTGTQVKPISTTDEKNKINISNYCGNFEDVSSGSFICSLITKLKNKGILSNNKYFNPEKNIIRAELLGIILKSAGIKVSYDSKNTFDDISTKDWWAAAVSTAKKLGLASKENKNYFPTKNITRAEALQIIMKAKKIDLKFDKKYSYNDIKSSDWWAAAVSTAKKLGYISKTNLNFRPNDPISRQEAIIILYNVYFK